MKARMEKYDVDNETRQRTKKNENLYSEVQNMSIDYVDIDVDNAVEITPSFHGKKSREDYQKQRELNKILPNSRETVNISDAVVEPKEDRVYDINEILKMARENKLFEENNKKRLINTEYNILTKLDVGALENETMKKEDLRSLIDDIYDKEKPNKLDKVQTNSNQEDDRLLSDLLEEPNDKENDLLIGEEISKEILDKEEPKDNLEDDKEEKEQIASQISPQAEEKIENSMYDFGLEKKSGRKEKKAKNLLEGVDLEKERKIANNNIDEDEYEEEKEGKGLVIAIIIVVILILLTCGFFVYEYFFGV